MYDELKQRVVLAAREAERQGMCKHKSGNFSLCVPETRAVLITPSGVSRAALSVERISVMDLDAHVIEWNGEDKPSSEVLMHLAIYRNRPDAGAVVHTHARYSTAFAIMNQAIPPIIYECSFLGRSHTIPVAPYARPGTAELADTVAETLTAADCCLMQSHGAVAIGKDMEEAFLRALYVEELAEFYYLALTIGGRLEGSQAPGVLDETELKKWAYPSEIQF